MGEDPETLAGMKNTGTYKRDPDNKFWYQFALTVKYDGFTHKDETRYVSKSSTVLKAPENTVITAISGVEEQNRRTVQSVNYNNALTDGWKQVQLLNLNADIPVTLTCKAYNHTVTWKEFYGANTTQANNTVVSYVSSTDTGVSQIFGGTVSKVAKPDGTAMNKDTDYKLSADEKTVTLNNAVSEDMELHVTTGNAPSTVTWIVTGPDGKPVDVAPTTTSTEGKASYTVKQPTNAWWVIEQNNYSASDSNVKTEVDQDKRTLTLSGITGPVTVTVNLTEYKHCINGTITYDQLKIRKEPGWGGSEYIAEFKSEFGKKYLLQSLYTNDDEYRWTIPGDGEKNLLTAITSISGCAIGEADKAAPTLRQEIGNTLTVQLTDKDVKLQVTTQNYLSKMTWEVTGPDTVDTKNLGYTEYYTAQVAEANQYVTLLSNGKTGVVDYEDYTRVASAYTVPDNIHCTVELANGDGKNVPADEAGKNACWSYTPTKMSKKFECYLEEAYDSAMDVLPKAVDSIAQLTLKPYEYTVKFIDAAKPSPSLKEYYVAEGTDSVTYNEGWMDEEWDKLCIIDFQIQGGNGAKLNGLSNTPEKGLIIEGKSGSGNEPGCKLTGITGNTTVKLTFAKCSDVFSKKIDWKIHDLKNNENYNYTEYLRKDETSGFVNAFEKTDGTANSHVWAGSKVTYTLPDGYENCYIKENTEVKTDRRSIAANTWNGKITIQPYEKRVIAYINGVPSEYYYFDTWEAQPSDVRVYCGDDIKVSRCIAKGCTVTNLNENDPTNRQVRVNSVDVADARVDIWTEPMGTDVTTSAAYYMGDMSFEYVRNAAAFTWDGKEGTTGSWKPVNAFGWRHAVGSKSYEVGGETLTVDNGSILFVNTMKNTPVTYTVQLSKNGTTDYGVSLMFDESDKAISVNEDGVATVTVPANSRVTLVCRMTGTPKFNGEKEINIGTITVTKK